MSSCWSRLRAMTVLVGVAMLLAAPVAAAPVRAAAAGVAGCAAPSREALPGVPWAQQRLRPDRAWPLTRGDSVLVAVLGTGVSAAAPALAGAVLPGLDVRNGRLADTDCAGYGTFVAGLVAARPGDRSGFAGIAPAARVLPVRVTDDPGQVDPGALAAGIRAAVDGGATVLAVPVGTPEGTPGLLAAVRYAGQRDAVVVAAADGTADRADGGTGRSYPAALPGVIGVGGIGPDGAPLTGGLAGGGPGGQPPAPPPALVAPGRDLVGIAPTGPGQQVGNGTGLAVGFVAGTAALVRAYHPNLPAPGVAARLLTTADHPTGRLPDPRLGYGVVDPVAAVGAVLPPETGDRAGQPAARPDALAGPAGPRGPHPGPASAGAGRRTHRRGAPGRGRRRPAHPGARCPPVTAAGTRGGAPRGAAPPAGRRRPAARRTTRTGPRSSMR